MSARPSQWYETPDLIGDQVILTQLRPRHAPGVLAAADDPSAFTWMKFFAPTNLDEASAVIQRYLDAQAQDVGVPWAQIDVASGEVAGVTTYYDVDPQNRSLAIGHTWLGKRFQRTAINTEAKLLLLTRAFETLEAARVVWHTDAENSQSREAIARLGATEEGILRNHRVRREGTRSDTAQFSMTDGDWPAVRERLRNRLNQS